MIITITAAAAPPPTALAVAGALLLQRWHRYERHFEYRRYSKIRYKRHIDFVRLYYGNSNDGNGNGNNNNIATLDRNYYGRSRQVETHPQEQIGPKLQILIGSQNWNMIRTPKLDLEFCGRIEPPSERGGKYFI